jgi:predicted nucleic acid-binding protein
MRRYVLDTEAFVLYLMAQEGGVIQRMLRDAEAGRHQVLMNGYNLAEVYVQLACRLSDSQVDGIIRATQALPIHRVPVTDHLVYSAARLRTNYPLETETAFALATAMQEEAILITATPLLRSPEGVAVCPLITSQVSPQELLPSPVPV